MKVILKSVVASLAVMSFAACSNNDLYDEGVVAANKTAEQQKSYENNFVKTYGAIAPNQSWDFSTNQQRLGTRAGETEIVTKTVEEGLNFDVQYKVKREWNGFGWNYYLDNRSINKNQDLLNNVSNKLKDGDKHTDVQKAVLVAPSNSFTIYPISVQGMWTHDLYVKVGNNAPVKVYSKTWTDFSHPYVNGDVLAANVWPVYGTEKDWWGNYIVDHYEYEATSTVSMPGLYVEAPIGTPIEIYLANVKEGKTEQPTVGTSTGHAIYVDGNGAVPTGIEVRDDAVIKYVGIEDNTTGSSDLDYNDVVLAIVGNPDVPKEIIIENNEYQVPVTNTKRYMMEDLGSTDDFDFNDVVVDVTRNTVAHHTVEIVDGVKTSDVVTSTDVTEKAVIKHFGGILPFVLKIGDKTLPELGGEDTFEKDVNLEYDITGWEPANNNISITVNNTTLSFPKAGAVPMIIACDDSEAWSAERVAFDWQKFLEVK